MSAQQLDAARREILTAIQNETPPETENEAFTRYQVVAGMLTSFPELTRPKKPNYNPDFHVDRPVRAGQACPKCGSTKTAPYSYWSKMRREFVKQMWRLKCDGCGAVTTPNEANP